MTDPFVLSTRFSARIADFYFAQGQCPPVDIRRYIQLSRPVEGIPCESFYTILIDLRQDEKTLFSKMKRDTRYDVRRATGTDGLLYECWQGYTAEVEEFADFYDYFATQVRRPKVSRSRLKNLAREGLLDVSRVSSPSGEVLVWHSHYRGNDRARLLESASLYRKTSDSAYRNYVGRANRYHHWRDMLRFKALGCSVYDLGGWVSATKDKHRLQISAFKAEFGGMIAENFNCTEPVTLKGKLATLWDRAPVSLKRTMESWHLVLSSSRGRDVR